MPGTLLSIFVTIIYLISLPSDEVFNVTLSSTHGAKECVSDGKFCKWLRQETSR